MGCKGLWEKISSFASLYDFRTRFLGLCEEVEGEPHMPTEWVFLPFSIFLYKIHFNFGNVVTFFLEDTTKDGVY